jgi:hypothetical protein
MAAPGAILEGTVRGQNGQAIARSRVSITSSPVPMPEIAALTDADGRFRFAVPVAGRYTLTAEADNVVPSSVSTEITVTADEGDTPVRPAPDLDSDSDPDEEVSSDDPTPVSRLPDQEARVITFEMQFGGPL